MAIGEKRSEPSVFNLSDENDLSESALDGVVGGAYGPTAGPATGQRTKDGGHELAEVTSLLHDAASLSVLQGDLEKMQKAGNGGQPTMAEQKLQHAIGALVDKDAATLTDLSSKLSAQQIGSLATAMEHTDAKATDAQIAKMAAGILPHESVTHGASGGSGVSSYLHDAASSAALQAVLDDNGGHATGHPTAVQQTLQSALGMIADKDGATLADVSSKLNTAQLDTLLTDADKVNAKTTNAEIEKLALEINKEGHNASGGTPTDSGGDWNRVKNVENIVI